MNTVQKMAEMLMENIGPEELLEFADFLDEASERAIDKLRCLIIEGVRQNA